MGRYRSGQTGQTVNLLALRLPRFESLPAQNGFLYYFMRYTIAHAILRLSLGLTYLWSGIDIIRHPALWVGWFPVWLTNVSPLKETPLLMIQAVTQLIIAAMLLIGMRVRWIAGLSVFFFTAILLCAGQYVITFRDIGLLGISLFLVLVPSAQSQAQE